MTTRVVIAVDSPHKVYHTDAECSRIPAPGNRDEVALTDLSREYTECTFCQRLGSAETPSPDDGLSELGTNPGMRKRVRELREQMGIEVEDDVASDGGVTVVECPACGAESECLYRFDTCGRDLAGETTTEGRHEQ